MNSSEIEKLIKNVFIPDIHYEFHLLMVDGFSVTGCKIIPGCVTHPN